MPLAQVDGAASGHHLTLDNFTRAVQDSSLPLAVPFIALTHLLEASQEVPQVARGVADDGGEAPAVCPLVLRPKHGQLCLRKVPEVGHHILPYGIRGRPLQAAAQPVRQALLLVATRGNSSLPGSAEQWHSV